LVCAAGAAVASLAKVVASFPKCSLPCVRVAEDEVGYAARMGAAYRSVQVGLMMIMMIMMIMMMMMMMMVIAMVTTPMSLVLVSSSYVQDVMLSHIDDDEFWRSIEMV
jgi:hypothetical protein